MENGLNDMTRVQHDALPEAVMGGFSRSSYVFDKFGSQTQKESVSRRGDEERFAGRRRLFTGCGRERSMFSRVSGFTERETINRTICDQTQ
jgi:hypothetical protein